MIHLYTDGSSRQVNGVWCGAYAFTLIKDDQVLFEASEALQPATNNVAEMVAVMAGLMKAKEISPYEQVTIYTDSTYVINGIKNHIHGYKPHTSNSALWTALKKVYPLSTIVTKVKAHADNQSNNRVDKLAYKKLNESF